LTVSTDPNKKFRKELNSGIVSMVLLSIMTNAKEPMYGYQIAENLEEKGEDVYIWNGKKFGIRPKPISTI